MTSHPDPSLLSALLRDREREAAATSEEVARLRDEVAGLTAERDWLLNRYVDAMENQGARLKVFDTYARALRAHEAHKSDPTRNVATGTALYAAEAAMRKLALEET